MPLSGDRIVAHYIDTEGGYHHGIPAHDLTADEFVELDDAHKRTLADSKAYRLTPSAQEAVDALTADETAASSAPAEPDTAPGEADTPPAPPETAPEAETAPDSAEGDTEASGDAQDESAGSTRRRSRS